MGKHRFDFFPFPLDWTAWCAWLAVVSVTNICYTIIADISDNNIKIK